jgi:hypothetical protein
MNPPDGISLSAWLPLILTHWHYTVAAPGINAKSTPA